MDFILNDKSLCGQFNSVSSFFDSLKNNVRCFELINDTEGSKIYKTQNFYKNKVTSNKSGTAGYNNCHNLKFSFS